MTTEFKLLTEEQLKACEASAPFMVNEYRKLMEHIDKEEKRAELATTLASVMLDRNKKLEAFISRLMWPIHTQHGLDKAVIDDAKNLGWDTKEWKK